MLYHLRALVLGRAPDEIDISNCYFRGAFRISSLCTLKVLYSSSRYLSVCRSQAQALSDSRTGRPSHIMLELRSNFLQCLGDTHSEWDECSYEYRGKHGFYPGLLSEGLTGLDGSVGPCYRLCCIMMQLIRFGYAGPSPAIMWRSGEQSKVKHQKRHC